MTLEVLMIICIAIILMCVAFFILKYYLENHTNHVIHGAFSYLAVIIMIIGIIIFGTCIDIKIETDLSTALAEDCPFYLNGVEVEPEDVYFGGYNIKYDKDEKKIFLYPKAGNVVR